MIANQRRRKGQICLCAAALFSSLWAATAVDTEPFRRLGMSSRGRSRSCSRKAEPAALLADRFSSEGKAGLRLSEKDIERHNAFLNCRSTKIFPVFFRTLDGNRCGPLGTGKYIENPDGSISDTRLTCPSHWEAHQVLQTRFVRFATESELRDQREAEQKETWWRHLEFANITLISAQTKHIMTGCIAIGSGGNEITVINAKAAEAVCEEKPAGFGMLEEIQCVRTPTTPPPF